MVEAGKSRNKARIKDADTFEAWAEKWLRGYQMAESTRDMRRAIVDRGASRFCPADGSLNGPSAG
jgi:hypothetical protein